MTDSLVQTQYTNRQAIAQALASSIEADPVAGMAALRKQTVDADEALRFDLLAMAWRSAVSSTKPQTRAALALYLVERADEDPDLRDQALKFLLDFSPEDFDAKARQKMAGWSLTDSSAAETARVLGVAQLRDAVAQLGTLSKQSGDLKSHRLYASPAWAATLALARMGEKESTEYVIAQVRRERDLILRSTSLFDDLAYTQQPAAFNLLREYLNSQARMPQVKDNVPGQLEAVRAATQFALYAKGCPVQGDAVVEADVPKIAKWASAQTSWTFRARAADTVVR